MKSYTAIDRVIWPLAVLFLTSFNAFSASGDQAMWTRLTHIGGVLWRTYLRWQNDDGPLMSAAVAYYLGLSVFPLVVTLISGVGLFFRYTTTGQDAEQQVLRLVADQASPALAAQMRQILSQIQDRSNLGGSLGLLGILIAAIAGFTQFERAFDHIWNVAPPQDKGIVAGLRHTLMERGVAFLMLLGTGLVVIAVFIANVVISSLDDFLRNQVGISSLPGPQLRFGTSLAINTMLFTALFRFLTPIIITWRDALRAGLFTAAGWEIGRILLGALVIGTRYSDAYGLIGSFLAVLLWCYYAIALVFLGAEYLKETITVQVAAPVTDSGPVLAGTWPPPPEDRALVDDEGRKDIFEGRSEPTTLEKEATLARD